MEMVNQLEEQWRKIENYPFYSVSNLGRVRSDRYGRILKPSLDTNGYPQVNLGNSMLIHHLVAQAFLGLRPEGHDIDHIDRVKSHNSLFNLRYLPINENRGPKRKNPPCYCILCGSKIKGPPKKLCSPKCHHAFYHKAKTCPICLKPFFVSNSIAKRNLEDPRYSGNFYCSQKCFFASENVGGKGKKRIKQPRCT